jgi:hypothetical protein
MTDPFREDTIEVIVEEVIDTLLFALINMFPNDIANAYFGDIVDYLPSAFIGPNQQQIAVVAIAPDFDHEIEGSQTAASEYRWVNLQVMCIVNITPEFRAMPNEAFGERRLLRLTEKVRSYLSKTINETIDERVSHVRVGDIDWTWAVRNEQALRISMINYRFRIRLNRM